MKWRYLFFIMIFATGFSACSDDDNPQDNPGSEEAVVNLNFDSTMEAETSRLANESRFIFSSGSISVENLVFRVANGDTAYEVDVLQGADSLLSIDLLTGIPSFVLDYFFLPTGEFQQVEVELTTGEEASALTGTFVDSYGEEYPIQIILPEREAIAFSSSANFVFLESNSVDAEVVLNPNSWVSQLNAAILNQLETTEDGRIVISETRNSDVLHIILEYLQESSEVHVKREAPSSTDT